MKKEAAYIVVGKIGSSHGTQGWLKIQTYTEFGASILDYHPWYLTNTEQTARHLIEIEESRIQLNGILVKFKDIDSPEEAKRLTNQLVCVPQSQLPALPADEFYWSDLIGLQVINQQGERLGIVTNLMETGANDVLIVKDDKEHGIPYLPGTVILKVDLEKGEIHVDWQVI
ncbi:MAG: ribosome maturation factor RimM [Gammaproteobacteria bacterium]|nr:ribosome maturation factor RimM [Gammaproteobacteria bacterium]